MGQPVLQIILSGAQELKGINFGRQDPYVVIEVGSEKATSKVSLGGGKNPIWNEAFQIRCPTDGKMRFTIFDKVVMGKDTVIGMSELEIYKVRERGRWDKPLQVYTTKGKLQGFLRITAVFRIMDGQEGGMQPPPSAGATEGNMRTWNSDEASPVVPSYPSVGSMPPMRRSTADEYARNREFGMPGLDVSTSRPRSRSRSRGGDYTLGALTQEDRTHSDRPHSRSREDFGNMDLGERRGRVSESGYNSHMVEPEIMPQLGPIRTRTSMDHFRDAPTQSSSEMEYVPQFQAAPFRGDEDLDVVLERMQQENLALKNNLAALNQMAFKQRKDWLQERSQLESQLSSLRDRRQRSLDTHDSNSEIIEHLRAERENLAGELEEVRGEKEELEAQISMLKSEYALLPKETHEDLTAAAERAAAAEAELADLERELGGVGGWRAELERLKDAVERSERRAAAAESRERVAPGKVAMSETELAEMRDHSQRLQEELDAAHAKIREINHPGNIIMTSKEMEILQRDVEEKENLRKKLVSKTMELGSVMEEVAALKQRLEAQRRVQESHVMLSTEEHEELVGHKAARLQLAREVADMQQQLLKIKQDQVQLSVEEHSELMRSKQELRELKGQLDELLPQVEDLQSKLQVANAKVVELESHKEVLGQQESGLSALLAEAQNDAQEAAEARDRADAARQEAEAAREEAEAGVEAMAREVESIRWEAESLRWQVVEKEEAVKGMEESIKALEESIRGMEEARADADKVAEELRGELAQLRSKHESAESQLFTERESRADLEAQAQSAAELAEQVSELKTKLVKVEDSLAAAKIATHAVDDLYTAAAHESEQLRAQLAEHQKKLQDADEKLQEALKKQQDTSGREKEIEEKLEQSKKAHLEMEEMYKSKSDAAESLRTQLAEAQNKLQEADREVAELKVSSKEAQEKHQAESESAAQLRQQVSELEDKLKSTEGKLEHAASTMKELEEIYNDLKTKSAAELASVRKDLETVSSSVSAAHRERDAATKSLKAAHEALEQKYTKDDRMLADLLQRNFELEMQGEDARHEVELLTGELVSAKLELARLREMEDLFRKEVYKTKKALYGAPSLA